MTDRMDKNAGQGGAGAGGKRYWRSLQELGGGPEFEAWVGREFGEGASELAADGKSRRGFLKVMGASLALAGLTSCMRWPEEKILPYAHRPANRTPGNAVHYATAWEIGGVGQGLLVESYDGRPTKIEGNPSHPLNKGAADVWAQASVLGLYDPDRSRGVIHHGKAASWEEFGKWAGGVFTGSGAGVAVLSEASCSPSVADMKGRIKKALPELQWYEYEPVSDDNARSGASMVVGQPVRVVLELAEAEVIVSLGADLFDGPMGVKYARDFAAGRRLHEDKKPGEMNRLWCVEAVYTNTGAAADHRRAVAPSKVEMFIEELARVIIPNIAGHGAVGSGVEAEFLAKLVEDLKKNPGKSVLVAGEDHFIVYHSLVAEMNKALGNVGKTVKYYADPAVESNGGSEVVNRSFEREKLLDSLSAGKVNTLLIMGGNPVYDALAHWNFGEAIKKAKTAIHFASHVDETSALCEWHLSRAHFLETWGDVRTFDGTLSIGQPLIAPLFDGKSTIELLAMLLGEKLGGQEIVQRTLKATLGGAYSEWKWKRALVEGVVEGTAATVLGSSPGGEWSYGPATQPATTMPSGAIEVVLLRDRKVYDGRFANNGWLQEMPDPMTRVTWDNAALMSPTAAAALGVADGDVVEIESVDKDAPSASVQAPVFVVPGMADGTLALPLGYGRTAAGNVGDGVGVNAYALRTFKSILVGRVAAKVTRTGKTYTLASAQQHHIIDKIGKEGVQERIPELIKEKTYAEYLRDRAAIKKPLSLSLFNEHKFDGRVDGKDPAKQGLSEHEYHKWGMVIDLTTCTGCGACVVACQAENNIPVVGREQVLLGREMHWIRIDRYFREDPERAVAVHQPVLCMHCENAPCEEVCPVAATTHSQEGLNMMTYNRCIGTRYCSNNCPYKVRRFNFFDYNRGKPKTDYTPNLLRPELDAMRQMQKNPEVTVRSRGVMEKCTYCVQRIEGARIEAKREGNRPIKDGEIQTACQQTCPTGAIVFGDLNDANSRVSKLHGLQRTYGMLEAELHTKPRTEYIARIRNVDEKLESTGSKE